jgi:hypothetical protein
MIEIIYSKETWSKVVLIKENKLFCLNKNIFFFYFDFSINHNLNELDFIGKYFLLSFAKALVGNLL